ncbi:unnamed protein product [Caenorhabditis bovis]|uniref:Uncharacterized protein n=1 Tax=Caenorhabditis bovis TaxID=2654633 RepID=A0A8S1F8Q0_9PELO|nr:unnamed protein product [Caenorhabditis bovis]
MFSISALIGIIPLFIVRVLNRKRNDEPSRFLSYLACFAGGTFLATCFLDIIPHINLKMEEASTWVVSDEKSNILKSLTFAVAMSFHSLLEGFALGVQDSTRRIYSLFFSLLLHKSVEAFSVGLQISMANSNKIRSVFITILIYSAMAPFGAIMGCILQKSEPNIYKDSTIIILESLAAGTFIYVTFIEIMASEKSNEFNHFKQLIWIIFGFTLVTVMQIFLGHEHGGDDDHHHHHHHNETHHH